MDRLFEAIIHLKKEGFMGRPKSAYPTEAEFQLLNWFWAREVATIRDVCDDAREAGLKNVYTSNATITRIMLEKGYLEIVDKRRPQKFKPTIRKQDVVPVMLRGIVGRLFGGNVDEAIKALTDLKKSGPPKSSPAKSGQPKKRS